MKQDSLAFEAAFGEIYVEATVVPREDYFELVLSGIGPAIGKIKGPRFQISRCASSCQELGNWLKGHAQKEAFGLADAVGLKLTDGLGKFLDAWGESISRGSSQAQMREAEKPDVIAKKALPLSPAPAGAVVFNEGQRLIVR